MEIAIAALRADASATEPPPALPSAYLVGGSRFDGRGVSPLVSEQHYKLFGAALAEARFDAGRVTDALALVDRAVITGEGPASGLFVREIHRLRGGFLNSLGPPPS